ncbi:deoxyribonuclease-2-alpha isoform X3 [Amia ocellicauda]|uniref:deoxyribonuclease-2-alpha isoform X3 n=1 Tax=Amia ocellicauda TaxID=2972642 RepID=UPI003463B472
MEKYKMSAFGPGWRELSCSLLLLFCCVFAGSVGVSCRNENGDSVDWYIVYNLPDLDRKTGLMYLYMDNNSKSWNYGKRNINDPESALAQTLWPFFTFIEKKIEGFGYLLYNDQPPKEYKTAPSSFGHSKGVVMLDRQTGVWLTHSTPQFPGKTRRSFWPSSGKSNGQTFFCGTYKYSNFSDIAIQLQYIHIYTFDFHVPTTFHDGLRCVAQRTCYPRKAPWFKRLEMKSLAGNTFISFAKYSRFQDDLYSGLLVDYLGDDIYSKSWGKLRRPLPSNCSGSHKVYNVQEMQLPQTQPFGTAVDHSKWCVTDSDGQPWTCIADMNREESQSKRGGGAVCTNDTGVWEAFRKIVNTYENCRHVEL